MKRESRVRNSFINGMTGFFGRAINSIVGLICRTIFIHVLSTEYLGVDGLFENILYLLNFAELGFGHVIIYNMYKPIANDDKEKIKALVHLYKKVYSIIGVIVLVLGLSLIPFLDLIIKDIPSVKENLTIIYILYLLQTLSTYFYGYKKSLLTAYQKEYITNITNFIFNITKNIIQILVLIFTQNYLLYLVIYILSNILSNVVISYRVDKLFPYLRESKYKNVSKRELSEIKTNVKSLIVFKVGDIVSNGTDNILLSIFSNVNMVGLFTNYTTIIKQASGIFWDFLNGLTGSIGNVNAKESNDKKEKILLQILCISSLVYGFLCICLGVLINPFISIWLGSDFLISSDLIFVYLFVIYFEGYSFVTHTYRNTEGLFRYARFLPIISAFVNLTLSIILGNLIGIVGIFVATIISKLLTSAWYMPYLIYKKCYNKKPFAVYYKAVYDLLISFITFIIVNNVVSIISFHGIFGFIIKCLVCSSISAILLCLFSFITKEFREIVNKLLQFIKRRGK